MRSATLCSSVFVLATTIAACKSDPPPIAECPAEGGESGGCSDEPPPDPVPECAEPEFSGMHPTATEYQCTGRAGGAIVYNQVVITVAGDPKGGPGSVQTSPAVTEFPSTGNDVSACCHSDPSATEIQDSACRSDCGRAACNRILDKLRDQVGFGDPSDADPEDMDPGKCDPIPDSFEDDCQERVRDSLQSWIDQIEANYDQCVLAAMKNSDPMLAYTDPEVPFADDGKLVFAGNGCNHDLAGCLYDAELRPFCEIDSYTELSTCEAAGNQEDPAADDGAVDDSSGGGGGGADPFGDISELVSCSPATTCTMEYDLLNNVFAHFDEFYDEGVTLTLGTWATGVTGLKIAGLGNGEDAKELCDAFSFVNNDVITHVNSVALDSAADIWDVIHDLEDVTTWYVTVRRRNGSTWATRSYTISLAVSITAPPAGFDAPEDGPNDSGVSDGSASSSCACQATEPAAAPLAMLLLGIAARRRRR